MLRVAHSREIEPGRTEGGRGCITRFGGEHFGNPLWLFPPRAHINKRANDVSHHVLQKSIGRNAYAHQCAAPHDLEFADRAHRRLGLAL